MEELKKKIIMWRTELERQQAGQGTMTVFDSICVFLGEQQRKNKELQKQVEYWQRVHREDCGELQLEIAELKRKCVSNCYQD